MGHPKQYPDQNEKVSGFYTVTDTPYALSNAASVVFDTGEATAILVVSTSGCQYKLGVSPDGTGTLHRAPAGAFPIVVKAGEQIYISGSATISVIE